MSVNHTEALQRIQAWCSAYPVDIFEPVDLKVAREALNIVGIDIGALHGAWARRLTQGIKEIADEALGSEIL